MTTLIWCADDHTPAKLAQFADVAQLVALLLQRSKYNADKLGLPALRSHLQHKIVQLLCRMNCNAFTICDDACAPVGLGVFPQGALFNHSCKPNCVVSFHGRQMNVHAIADIAQNEELLVSYVDVLASSSTRQRELRESYFFSCRCDRCSEDTALEDAYLDGYVCPDASCTQTKGGVLVLDSQGDSECRICGAKRSTSELQRLELEYAELSARQSSDVVAQWQLYRRCWQLLAVDMRVHPRSTRVAALARAMGNFLLNEPSLDDGEFTARLCFQRELEAMQWILPELPLPARGILHYALGKWIHEHQQKKATEHLRQALIVYVGAACWYGIALDPHSLWWIWQTQLRLRTRECARGDYPDAAGRHPKRRLTPSTHTRTIRIENNSKPTTTITD